jgi:cobalt-zinc-cadmium efflux system membrane fusion protein
MSPAKFRSSALLCTTLAMGCGRSGVESEKAAPAPSAHADEPAHPALPKRVRLEPSVVVSAKITTAPVVRAVLAVTTELPGEVTSDPDKTARVTTLVDGRIDSVAFKEGQVVKKGDVLAVIKVPELGKAKAAYAATAARAQSARANADRLTALGDKRLASNQEVVAANAEASALEAETRAAAEQLRALGAGATTNVAGSELALRAPVSGTVVSRDAVVGQSVTAGHALATIADLAEVWFLGRIFEKNLEEIHAGAPADVRLNAYPRETFQGAVDYVSKQIDPTARTFTARIRLANRGDLLRLGLFGVARVGTGEEGKRAPALVVPRSAVTEIGHEAVVFVRQKDGDYDVHEVVLGEGALGKVEIVSGLDEGEQVVVDGVFTLKSAVLKSTFGEAE